jgi:hypothetical protein
MSSVLFQPHSGKDSSFPYSTLLPSKKLRTSSLSNSGSRQLSITDRNKPIDGVLQLEVLTTLNMVLIVSNVSPGNDNVDGNESNDDKLPSLQRLLPPTVQARQSNLNVS